MFSKTSAFRLSPSNCKILNPKPYPTLSACPPHRKAVTLQGRDSYTATVSASTRDLLQQYSGRPPPLSSSQAPPHPDHLATPAGGMATLRLAQVLLVGFCAKLPGGDR